MINIIRNTAAAAALMAALCANAQDKAAANLDQHDAGEYVMLNAQQEPTPMQMRFYRRGKQWMMDGKSDTQDWHPVCRGDGQCRLQASPAAKVREWKQVLPRDFQAMPMACIHNIAFAFCRISKPEDSKQRLYWWIVWQNGQTHALGLNRLR